MTTKTKMTTNNCLKNTKKWKLNFLACAKYHDEFTRWIDAETKEDAINKLKEHFYAYDLKNIYLLDVKSGESV